MKNSRQNAFLRGAAAAMLALALASCAARQDKNQIDAELGCHFDAMKVCQQAATQPMNYASGLTTSNQTYFQQNQPATSWVQAPIRAPGGSEVDVQCQIKTQNMKVIYAYAVPSGKVSDSDRQWLIQTGLCREPGSTAVPTAAPGVTPPTVQPQM
jgi:hypothetical protein